MPEIGRQHFSRRYQVRRYGIEPVGKTTEKRKMIEMFRTEPSWIDVWLP
jgi:hypothetical protein